MLLDDTELERLLPVDEDLLKEGILLDPLDDEDLNEDDPELLMLLLPVEEERLITDLPVFPEDDLLMTDPAERLTFVLLLDERLYVTRPALLLLTVLLLLLELL